MVRSVRPASLLIIGVLLLQPGCEQQAAVSAKVSPDGDVEILELSAEGQIEHQPATFLSVVNRTDDRIVVVDFWATWCGPCLALAPELEEVKQDWGDKIVVVKVNVDDNRDIANHFEINSIPDVRFLRNGQPVGGFVGLTSSSAISSKLKTLQ